MLPASPTGLTSPPTADLPIHAHRDELLRVIAEHQVVVVAGETGSGKSTQLPQLCLELGRGRHGLVAHTQPRRIAARSIAERIAEELGTRVGDRVGYQVRFTDEVSENTELKVMTDGILLAEIQRDRQLRRYSTIIIDEAHERTLNIDFLLGWLHHLLPRRPDLKLIITSATIDTERFARHFDDAPVVEVSGRSYPVEIRYRPPDGRTNDQADAICAAVQELWAEPDGDILVFCSGEREIRDAIDSLAELDLGGPRPVELVPLFGRLSAAEQHRVFASHRTRRIVVSTNVAETSLTVPGIRYVVDTGTARISRFNRRTKVQRLPIEPISRASANQRAGRCGRVAPGVCIRLYDEADFESRPEFTDPEIQRTNLASVILQMAAAGLGDVETFAFVDPPDARAISDGIALLEELGAVRPGHRGRSKWITGTGRRLARLPLDPRLGRMLIEAEQLGCLDEVRVIVAALSIQDPRERPLGEESAADASHRRFADPDSDLLSWLHLWDHLAAARQGMSSNQFRRYCRREYLHSLRVREWQDLHAQIGRLARQLGWDGRRQASSPKADRADLIHQAILSGLLSHAAVRRPEGRDYTGARNARLSIARGSVLHGASPKWIMAAELVETNRLWARQVARIRPEWLEHQGGSQCRHSFGDPWWDETEGLAKVHHSVTLFGLPVATNRTELLHRHDRDEARYLLLSNALVEGRWGNRTTYGFVEANRTCLDDVEALEIRSRRDDLRVDHATLVRWFDERIDPDVATVKEFDRWWKTARNDNPGLLTLTETDVLAPPAEEVEPQAFPETWQDGPVEVDLTYVHDPGHHLDGIVIDLALADLGALDGGRFDWLVPGLRRDLVEGLLRTLPKSDRKALMPLAERAAQVAAALDPEREPDLRTAVARAVTAQTGVTIAPASLDTRRLPTHLRPFFRVHDPHGSVLVEGSVLSELRHKVDHLLHDALSEADHPLRQTGMSTWECEELPPRIATNASGYRLEVIPALIDEGSTVGVELLSDPAEAEHQHWLGVRRLLSLNRGSLSKVLRPLLTDDLKLALLLGPYDGPRSWLDDCVDGALEALMLEYCAPGDESGLPRDREAFERLAERIRSELTGRVAELAEASAEVLITHRELVSALDRRRDAGQATTRAAADDVERQTSALVYPGFLSLIDPARLPDVARYLRAATHRLERVVENPGRDIESMRAVADLERRWEGLDPLIAAGAEAEEFGWLLQELRVHLFAQHLGTRETVSVKRVRRALDRLSLGR